MNDEDLEKIEEIANIIHSTYSREITEFLRDKSMKAREIDVVLFIISILLNVSRDIFCSIPQIIHDKEERIDYNYLIAKTVNTLKDALLVLPLKNAFHKKETIN